MYKYQDGNIEYEYKREMIDALNDQKRYDFLSDVYPGPKDQMTLLTWMSHFKGVGAAYVVKSYAGKLSNGHPARVMVMWTEKKA